MGKMKQTDMSGDAQENKDKVKNSNKKEEKIHIAGLKGGQRIKAIDAEVTPEAGTEASVEEKKVKEPKVRSKKYQESKAKVAPGKSYSLPEALKLAQETSYSKFDGTIELHLLVKKTGTSAQVILPHSGGREKKIEIASEATLEKLKAGKIDFDVLLATADMMPKLVVFARILGPKGMMPNPKNGTLISDVSKAKNFSGNTVNLKTEKEAPIIHTAIGKVSQKLEELVENAKVVMGAGPLSKQILKAYTKASMGPSVRIEIKSN